MDAWVLWLLVLALVAAVVMTEVRARWLREHGDHVASMLQGDATGRMLERRRQVWESRRYDETGFTRLGPPREGEWLHRFPEAGASGTKPAVP